MRIFLRFSVFALLLLVAAACSSSRQPGSDPGPAARGATVKVDNNALLDVNVFVVQASGSRTRLGLVNSTSSAVFRIPSYAVGLGQQLRFLVDPVGSDRVATSFELYVRPDQQVTLTIPSTIGR